MIVKKLLFALTITFLPAALIAQNWKADIEKACEIFHAEAYEIEIEFRKHDSNRLDLVGLNRFVLPLIGHFNETLFPRADRQLPQPLDKWLTML